MKIKRLTETAILPTKANPGDLGYDLYADEEYRIAPGQMETISTGIAIEFPLTYGGIIKDRSSVAQRGLVIHAGVIDQGYRGEIKILVQNILLDDHIFISEGQKIAQLILIPIVDEVIEEVETLSDSPRGEKGFGSSGQ